MQIDAVDIGLEVVEGVQVLFYRAPIKTVLPVLKKLAKIREFGAVIPCGTI